MDNAMDDVLIDPPSLAQESSDLAQETRPEDVFIPPSIDRQRLFGGKSYTYHSEVPAVVLEDASTEYVLGVDEAGRGPVLGPMVYALLYLPIPSQKTLLADAHHFHDSKVLTPKVRSALMELICKPDSNLYHSCGWATRVMSARDISAGMMKTAGTYNLNAQAMDATIDLIQEVFAKGVNIKEIYIDTIGTPSVYQKMLERIFPTAQVTVAKKADSLYPCVSAASVCAKVTRDAALEICYESYRAASTSTYETELLGDGWGSGYPSDTKCTSWLKRRMDPLFGWGIDCRFSWGTAKDLLETKTASIRIDWPIDDDDDTMKLTQFFGSAQEQDEDHDELSNWFGKRVTEKVF